MPRPYHAIPDYRAMFDLTGKTAVVLGAASGIGAASAEALGALGALGASVSAIHSDMVGAAGLEPKRGSAALRVLLTGLLIVTFVPG